MPVEFRRTAKAATSERMSTWFLIESIAADATDVGVPISGAESVLAAKEALDAAGCEYADGTIKNLCVVAKFDHESTPTQRKVWRRYGWTSVAEVAQAGWSPEAAAQVLDRPERLTRTEVRAAVRQPRHAGVPEPRSFEDRCASWIHAVNRVLMEGTRLAQEAESWPDIELGAHAALAIQLYQRLTERALDAELRSLLEAQA
jgi:hypothetical protein